MEDIESGRLCHTLDTHLKTGRRLAQELQQKPMGKELGSEVHKAQSVTEDMLEEMVSFLLEEIFPDVCRRKSVQDYFEAEAGTKEILDLYEEALGSWRATIEDRADQLGIATSLAFPPTPTPEPGGLNNPVPIGHSVTVELMDDAMTATVLEVRRGGEATEIAKRMQGQFGYTPPVTGEEHLAVRVEVEWFKGREYEKEKFYLEWNFALHFDDGTELTPLVTPTGPIAEGYLPLSGEGWVLWKIKAGSKPLLRFQPHLSVVSIKSRGAYMALE